jgi:hypothetical protein
MIVGTSYEYDLGRDSCYSYSYFGVVAGTHNDRALSCSTARVRGECLSGVIDRVLRITVTVTMMMMMMMAAVSGDHVRNLLRI